MKKIIIASILFMNFNIFSMIVNPDNHNDIKISRVSLFQMASAKLCAQAREKNENRVSEYIGRHYVWGEESEPEVAYAQKIKNSEDFLKIPGASVIFESFVVQAKTRISQDALKEERKDVVEFIKSLN